MKVTDLRGGKGRKGTWMRRRGKRMIGKRQVYR